MDAARTSQDMSSAADMSPERGPAGDAGRLYEDLIQAHAAGVWRMAYRLTGDHGDADDLCQEAYYEAWRSIRSLRDPKAGRAWLIRILVHRASRRMRRIRLQPNEERQVQEDQDADLAAAAPEGELLDRQEDIQDALDALDPDRRTVFLLVFLEGFTCREVGEMLDIPLGTVLSRIHRARSRLRHLLRHRAPTTSAGGAPMQDSGMQDSGIPDSGIQDAGGAG